MYEGALGALSSAFETASTCAWSAAAWAPLPLLFGWPHMPNKLKDFVSRADLLLIGRTVVVISVVVGRGVVVVVVNWNSGDDSSVVRLKPLTTQATESGGSGGVS